MARIRENSIVMFERSEVVDGQGFAKVLKIYNGSCLVEVLISDIDEIVVKESLNKFVLSKRVLTIYSEQRMLQSELYCELLKRKR